MYLINKLFLLEIYVSERDILFGFKIFILKEEYIKYIFFS